MALSEEDLAAHYVQAKGDVSNLPSTAASLVEDVRSYLRRNGLDHRLDDAVDIAVEAFKIAGQIWALQKPVPGQVEEAWQADWREGHGDRPQMLDDAEPYRLADQRALAARVRNTSMADWGAERIRLGIAPKSAFDHLAGTGF